MQSHYIFLINWHYIVVICLFVFVNSSLTTIPFIKAIKGENIQAGEYFL